MPLVKDTSVDGVQLSEACQIDVVDDGIEKKVEVFISSRTSIDVVEGGYAVIVIDLFTDRVENLV